MNDKLRKVLMYKYNAEVRWNNDFDTEDTYPDSKHTIVSMYNCDECDTWYEVFHQKKEKKDE